MRIKITETKSGEYFEFEVRRDSRLWDSSSALKQIFDELGLEQPGGRIRYILALGDGKQIVSDVAAAKNLIWADLGAKDGDEYVLESFPRSTPERVTVQTVAEPVSRQRHVRNRVLVIALSLLLVGGVVIGVYSQTYHGQMEKTTTKTLGPTVLSQASYDQSFSWISGQHIVQQDDFAISPDFTVETPYQQFAVTRLEVMCSMRDVATTGAAVWDIGAMVKGQPATWSKPPPSDYDKDEMNYRGVAFGQVEPGWSGQPFFYLDYGLNAKNAAGAPIYNENWMRLYGNRFNSRDGRVHVTLVVWTGLGQTDIIVDSCSVRVIFIGAVPATATASMASSFLYIPQLTAKDGRIFESALATRVRDRLLTHGQAV